MRPSLILAYLEALSTSENDWSQPTCSDRNTYDYRTGDVCEVFPAHRCGCSYPSSKLQAREEVKMVKFFDVKDMLNKRKKVLRVQLERALDAAPDEPFDAVRE